VADGNYLDEGGVTELWPAADTLIWLDLPRPVAFARAVRRSAIRVVRRQPLWNRNQENLCVLSPGSLLRMWRRWPSYSERVRESLRAPEVGDLVVVHLRSRREVRIWLNANSYQACVSGDGVGAAGQQIVRRTADVGVRQLSGQARRSRSQARGRCR
jgi:hypothetical protein